MLGPLCTGFQVLKKILALISTIANYCSYRFLNSSKIISLQIAVRIHDTKEQIVRLCAKLKLTGEKPVTLLAFLANLKETLSRCCECASKAFHTFSRFSLFVKKCGG